MVVESMGWMSQACTVTDFSSDARVILGLPTITTPLIPCPPEAPWTSQWYLMVPGALNICAKENAVEVG